MDNVSDSSSDQFPRQPSPTESFDSDYSDYSDNSDGSEPLELRQSVKQHEDQGRERPVQMDQVSTDRKRRRRGWGKHVPIDHRPTADGVRPYLYRLPIELFTMTIDYLDLRDILYLCQDPGFPVKSLLRRHLVSEPSSYSILHQVIDDDWSIIPVIEKFMQILGAWDVPGPSGMPLLNESIVCERADLCRLFIEAGTRVNFLVPTQPPERSSNFIGHAGLDAVDHFVTYEAQFYWAPDSPELEPLHLAAIVDSLEIVDLLLQHGANPNALAGKYGSPLHLANDCKVAESLISKGANVNALNGTGSTPLFMAVAMGSEALIELLLERGADIKIHNRDRLSVLTLACKVGNAHVVHEALIAGCEVHGLLSIPSLHIAVLNENEDVVRELLKHGADVSFQSSLGTALHITRKHGMAQILLAAGADVDEPDFGGQTPLQLAVLREDYEMFNILLTAGADWKSPDIDWGWFIFGAAFSGEYSTVRLILTHCNIKISERNYVNPLPSVIEKGHVGVARLLIEHDPDLVHQADDEGVTPIRSAICCRTMFIIELLAAGARPSESDLNIHIDGDSDSDSNSNSDGPDGKDIHLAIANALLKGDLDKAKRLVEGWMEAYKDDAESS